MVIFIGYMIGMGFDLSLAGLLWLDGTEADIMCKDPGMGH